MGRLAGPPLGREVGEQLREGRSRSPEVVQRRRRLQAAEGDAPFLRDPHQLRHDEAMHQALAFDLLPMGDAEAGRQAADDEQRHFERKGLALPGRDLDQGRETPPREIRDEVEASAFDHPQPPGGRQLTTEVGTDQVPPALDLLQEALRIEPVANEQPEQHDLFPAGVVLTRPRRAVDFSQNVILDLLPSSETVRWFPCAAPRPFDGRYESSSGIAASAGSDTA